jgi:hypothetical protein
MVLKTINTHIFQFQYFYVPNKVFNPRNTDETGAQKSGSEADDKLQSQCCINLQRTKQPSAFLKQIYLLVTCKVTLAYFSTSFAIVKAAPVLGLAPETILTTAVVSTTTLALYVHSKIECF